MYMEGSEARIKNDEYIHERSRKLFNIVKGTKKNKPKCCPLIIKDYFCGHIYINS